MSRKVNIHEAKTHFSMLLQQVGKGDEIIIANAGKPVARLIPFLERSSKRVPGTAKGKVRISKDFDAPLPKSLQKLFE